MTDYRFQDHFDAAPLGALTTANKKLAWPDSTIYSFDDDPDPNGTHFSIVEDSRFDLWPPNDQKLGGGKIGPAINWGEVGGATELRGTRVMWWYNGNGSLYQAGKWSPICQDQRSGDPLIKPSQYSPDVIACEHLYKFRVRVLGGPSGYAHYWYNDQPLASSIEGHALQVTAEDDVLYDFAFFAGGGEVQACRWDSYARVGNIHAWSGDGEWAQQPQPGQTYHLEGTFTGTITPVTGGR